MAEGSLFTNLQNLESAFTGIQTLLGDGDSGLSGAASLSASSPSDQTASFEASLTVSVDGTFAIDAEGQIDGIVTMFSDLRGQIENASPADALAIFTQQLSDANVAIAGDFVTTLQTTRTAIESIIDGVPPDHSAIVNALLDQILTILGALNGEEAQAIQAWVQSLAAMTQRLLPLIEEAQNSPDPAQFALRIVGHVLDNFLERLGFGRIQRFIQFLDTFPRQTLDAQLIVDLNAAISVAQSAYGDALAAVGGDWPDFREPAVHVIEMMHDLERKIEAVLEVIERIVRAKIFQPNALETFLREQFQKVCDLPVQDVAVIDNPYNALLDKIDAAIDGIDLDFVRDDVLGFFETTRQTIEQVNIPNVADALSEQLAVVTTTVQSVQDSVSSLLADIEQFFDDLIAQLRGVAANVGTFQGDGSFEYGFMDELRQLFNRARLAIGGDPDNPNAPSFRGTIDDFQTTIDQFLTQLDAILQPVETAVGTVANDAVQGIDEFSAFVDELKMPELIEQMRGEVQQIVDQLPLDFASLVDPVIVEIEANEAKLAEIDTSDLNELLREALALALDVIISIDFSAEISNPLKDEFAVIQSVPKAALDHLQAQYEQALSRLDALSPTQLLAALFAAFDTIDNAISSLDVASLFAPLDQLHAQYLQQPLAELQPSSLLQPVSDSFNQLVRVFDTLDASALLQPITEQLDQLKSAVLSIDLTQWIDELLAVIAQVQQTLRDIRPTDLLQPIIADFNRLEGELDRIAPSTVFAPIAGLATPLLTMLEDVQAETTQALFDLFKTPLEILDSLRPTALSADIQANIDLVLAAIRAVQLPAIYNQFKASYFDLKAGVELNGHEAKLELVVFLDPDRLLGDVLIAHNALVAGLEGARSNVAIPALTPLYDEMHEKLLNLLPPYAKAVIEPEVFKRLMRMADPTRFLADLDTRFEAIKAKLLPIRPEELSAELDTTYESVLALVDNLDVSDPLNQLKTDMTAAQNIVNSLRVDFLAADIDRLNADVQAMVQALNPATVFGELDTLHADVTAVVADTQPSQLLAGLQTLLDDLKAVVAQINPRTTFSPPIEKAWESITDALNDIDITIILSPLVEKLAALQADFELSLRAIETAFDNLLRSAKGILNADGSVSISVSASI